MAGLIKKNINMNEKFFYWHYVIRLTFISTRCGVLGHCMGGGRRTNSYFEALEDLYMLPGITVEIGWVIIVLIFFPKNLNRLFTNLKYRYLGQIYIYKALCVSVCVLNFC